MNGCLDDDSLNGGRGADVLLAREGSIDIVGGGNFVDDPSIDRAQVDDDLDTVLEVEDLLECACVCKS